LGKRGGNIGSESKEHGLIEFSRILVPTEAKDAREGPMALVLEGASPAPGRKKGSRMSSEGWESKVPGLLPEKRG